MIDFRLGDETQNRVLACHHESADMLCPEPVCPPLDAGVGSYRGDLVSLPPQNAFDGHGLLQSCGGLTPCLTSPRSCEHAMVSVLLLRAASAYHIGGTQ